MKLTNPFTKALADAASMPIVEIPMTLNDGSIFIHAKGQVSWQDFYRYTNKGETK